VLAIDRQALKFRVMTRRLIHPDEIRLVSVGRSFPPVHLSVHLQCQASEPKPRAYWSPARHTPLNRGAVFAAPHWTLAGRNRWIGGISCMLTVSGKLDRSDRSRLLSLLAPVSQWWSFVKIASTLPERASSRFAHAAAGAEGDLPPAEVVKHADRNRLEAGRLSPPLFARFYNLFTTLRVAGRGGSVMLTPSVAK
jgi:hypothetical protein